MGRKDTLRTGVFPADANLEMRLEDPQAASVFKRLSVLNEALNFLDPVLGRYGLEPHKVVTSPAGPLSVPASYISTPAEQVVSLAKDVAEWLLEE